MEDPKKFIAVCYSKWLINDKSVLEQWFASLMREHGGTPVSPLKLEIIEISAETWLIEGYGIKESV